MEQNTQNSTMPEKTADELRKELERSDDLSRFLADHIDSFDYEQLHTLLKKMIRERNITKTDVAAKADMSEIYLYQLLSGQRHPSRNRLLCIGRGMSCTLEEMQKILLTGGYAQLYPRHRRDAIIMYGFLHDFTKFRINDCLEQAHEESLD